MMNRLISFTTKRNAIAATIATNYWIQYNRRDGQSLQSVANNRSKYHSLLRITQMSDPPLQPALKPFSDEWFLPFVSIKFGNRISETGVSSINDHDIGSGFICHKRGFVLTRFEHRARENSRFRVRLGDGSQFDAHLVKTVEPLNLRILALEDRDAPDKEWPTVQLAERVDLKAKQTVLSVSNAVPSFKDSSGFDLRNQITDGVVVEPSMFGARITRISDMSKHFPDIVTHCFIHHTALIDKGDTGTALVDTGGRVVGITIHTYDTSDNIALSITDPLITKLMTWLKTFVRESDGPPLGLVAYWLDNKLRQKLQTVHQFDREIDGILIWDFTPEFNKIVPTLERFDVITNINGVDVQKVEDMYRAVQMLKGGEPVLIQINKSSGMGIALQPKALLELHDSKTRFI